VVGAASAALAPAVASLVLLIAELPEFARWAMAVAGLLGALTGLYAVFACLRPLAAAAQAIGQAHNVAKDARGRRRNEVDTILAAIGVMNERVSSLQHRWAQQHPLTALPTREFLLAEIQQDMDGKDNPTMLGVLRLRDYDRLAAFDSSSADTALKLFAKLLSTAVGNKKPLAQVDRDSFAIWFRGSSPENAKTELRALCYALRSELIVDGVPILPEVEASAASFPADGLEPSTLLTRALISLDKNERNSGGEVKLQAPKPAQAARESFSWEQDLRHAISRDQLELHFQPVVDLGQGRVVGAEALIRWNHPEAGLVSPARFIPILEDAHLTDEIGMWTLNAACRAARGWRTQGLEGLTVAVNLSATQLKNPDLVRMIARTLERHNLPARALELELTETAATEDAERTFRLFSELRAMGVSLAIDDFGSGYSSLSYVKNLPFDKLKIDREFVVEVHLRPDSEAICRTLIELARGLRIRLLAEGVETASEIELLRRIGCTLFQGYYFSPPLSDAQFISKASDADWERSLLRPFEPVREHLDERLPA
jgi:Amt family ammonium transporter